MARRNGLHLLYVFLLITKNIQSNQFNVLVKQMNHESKLAEYIEERMLFLDQVRKHLSGFPLRPHLESHSAIPSSSTAKSRDLRELNKVEKTINTFDRAFR